MESDVLDRVQSLNLPQLPGTISAHYVSGQTKRAQQIQSMLEDAASFFEDQLGVTADPSVALLGPTEWRVVADEIPYGLPWVSGPPYVTVLPATLEHPLAQLIIQITSESKPLLSLARPTEQIADDFIALIGFHEIGHVITWQYGIEPPSNWISEILASYLAYGFMKARHPQQATLWQEICELMAQNISPQHTTLTDFEALYSGVGIENYSWYQGIFQRRVDELFRAHGLDFVRLLKDTLRETAWSENEDPLFLEAMEEVSPGFQAWADQNRLS